MRIAVSGHRDLSPETACRVRSAMREILQPLTGELVGVSCLAPGTDQIFADVVLELGGRLEVVVPARQYGPRLPEAHRLSYDERLRLAASVRESPFELPSPEAYASVEGDQADAQPVQHPGPGRGPEPAARGAMEEEHR